MEEKDSVQYEEPVIIEVDDMVSEDEPMNDSVSEDEPIRGEWKVRYEKSRKDRFLQSMRFFYFPIVIMYLQLVFHVYMGLSFRYIYVLAGFSYVVGMLVSIIVNVFPNRLKHVIISIFTAMISLIYCGEMICKDVLQRYYPLFSAADTAASNHLTNFWGAAVGSIVRNLPGILLFLIVPAAFCVYLFFMTKEREVTKKMQRRTLVAMCMRTLLVYVIMMCCVKLLPWKSEFSPKYVYASDTNIEEQVEQFGLLTMIWLDGKHSVLGVSDKKDITIQEQQLVEKEEEKKEEVVKEEEKPEIEEPVIDTSPNVMNLDFDTVAKNSSNKDVKWLSKYFASATPSKKNQYTGMFKDYNVIFITAEGFSGYMVNPELTPTLYKMTHEGFQFENFYSPLHFTSTSGGEWQNLTGFYPKNGFPISMTESGIKKTMLPFTLAKQLNKQGYVSTGFHFYQNMYGRDLSHPNLGYQWRQANKCKNPVKKEKRKDGKEYWPQSDDYMIRETVQNFVSSDKPFNVYYLTLSGHLPYNLDSNAMANRNKAAVAKLPYSAKTKGYIAANLELEKGLTRLITELEKAGKADKTLLVLAPDHIPYGDVDIIEELAGKSLVEGNLSNLEEESIDFDVYKNALAIWSPSMKKQWSEPVKVNKVCCQVDILPTLLNLLGVEYDSRLFSGSDILSDSEGMVVFSSRCWLTDRGLYNRFEEKFFPAKGVTMTADEQNKYVNNRKNIASCRAELAPRIIETNYFKLLFKK